MMLAFSLLAGGSAFGQQAATGADTIPRPGFVSGLDVLIDYGKLITYPFDFEQKLEGAIQLRLYDKVAVVAEVGNATLNPANAFDNTTYYTIEGSYFRAGADYYLDIDPRNALYFGLRYAHSQFEDRGEYIIPSDLWPLFSATFGSDDLQAIWAELIMGTESYLNFGKTKSERFLIGWLFRLRIMASYQSDREIEVYSIPGYGRSVNKTTPALNFYVKFRLGR